MRASLSDVLEAARIEGFAVAACNVYSVDQASGVLEAATEVGSPIVLQLHPSGLGQQLWPMLAALRVLADAAVVPCVVHLDHCADVEIALRASSMGADSVMIDGSQLPFDENAALGRGARRRIPSDVEIEAELGRLSGAEDGASIDVRETCLTDPATVAGFVAETGIGALAVSIGNVHGETPVEPQLDFDRLAAIRGATSVALVLHGASGLATPTLRRAIAMGVTKVNINTELRRAYVRGLTQQATDGELVAMLGNAREAVRSAAREVIERLRSPSP